MTSLVTGADGFIGSHLVDFLQMRGDRVVTVSRSQKFMREGVCHHALNILDCEAMASLIRSLNPDHIYHLAAQSLPGTSWTDPKATFRTNVDGTLNILDAIVATGAKTRLIFASSSSVYSQNLGAAPMGEDSVTLPTSPYGVSKLAAEQLVSLYCLRHGLSAVIVRPFFIIGTRKTGDVCSDWARNIVGIENGALDELRVGNLGVIRDFLSIEDGVSALCTVAEKGASGKTYNICSGVGWELTQLLDTLRSLSGKTVPVKIDPGLHRPIDERIRVGDPSRLKELGWMQQHRFEDTLKKILEYWRVNYTLQAGSTGGTGPKTSE